MDCLMTLHKISEFCVILKIVNDQISRISQAHFEPQLWFTGAKSI